jgi:hypothetical protein
MWYYIVVFVASALSVVLYSRRGSGLFNFLALCWRRMISKLQVRENDGLQKGQSIARHECPVCYNVAIPGTHDGLEIPLEHLRRSATEGDCQVCCVI